MCKNSNDPLVDDAIKRLTDWFNDDVDELINHIDDLIETNKQLHNGAPTHRWTIDISTMKILAKIAGDRDLFDDAVECQPVDFKSEFKLNDAQSLGLHNMVQHLTAIPKPPQSNDAPPQYCIELAISISDYVTEYGNGFDTARGATDDVKDLFNDLCTNDNEFKSNKVISIEFVEFDSTNPSHAAAYFNVNYTGCEFPEDETCHFKINQ